MINQPFFSILVPTKNRLHSVSYSIESILQQDIDDYEIIVCDNSDDYLGAESKVRSYQDERIKYIKTGGLSMVENWNLALDNTCGKNIIVLGDKMAFYNNSLKIIKEKIRLSPSGVVVWRADGIEDDGPAVILSTYSEIEDLNLSSEIVLRNIVNDFMGHWQILPRGLCTSVPKNLINKITSTEGVKFYDNLSPDFVSAIKILTNIGEYIICGKALSLSTSSKLGNGKKIMMREYKNLDYMGLSNNQINLESVHVKSPFIVVNTVIADYLEQQKKIGLPLSKYKISDKKYFEMLFMEFLVTTRSKKKIVWTLDEIVQLFSSGGGIMINIALSINLIVQKVLKKIMKKQRNSLCNGVITIKLKQKIGRAPINSIINRPR